MRRLVIADRVDAATRAELRGAAFEPYWIADRGRYHRAPAWSGSPTVAPEGSSPLGPAVARLLPPELADRPVLAALLSRLQHRDYVLPKGSASLDPDAEAWLDVSIDLSASPSAEAQIVVSDGVDAVYIPQTPGLLVAVERSAGTVRYERYLNHRVGEHVVHRLRLVLPGALP